MSPGSDAHQNTNWDTSKALQAVKDQPRANLLADIVGHPKGAPSVAELDYMNPALKQRSIRRYLADLVDKEILTEQTFDPGNRTRGYPYKFYTVTIQARELFDEHNLFPKQAWQRQYESVEKTADIRELEQRPRPDDC